MKQYTYYVATFNRWVLIQADDAREALELGEKHPELENKVILTVRISTIAEREQVEWHEKKLAEEGRTK